VSSLVVVKVGGSLGRMPGALPEAGRALAEAAHHRPLLVLPGGGVLADAVRALDRELALPATTAHWMAILAMDQYAQVIAAHTPNAAVVHDRMEIGSALGGGRIPVLAPYRWMLAADVLPHRWEVTSDSIAAFVAGALDAVLLVLLKPVSGPVATLADPCFAEVVPAGLRVVVVGAEELDRLAPVVADCGPGEAPG
jgi:5-(aminomethyl)-3-furanmethanol phosphate kinase